MHLESKFTMSLVLATTLLFLFFLGGGGVLRHLVVQTNFEFKISGPQDCTVFVATTKMLISCEVTAQLICVFVFAFANSRFSHDTAHLI